jgi:transcriptional regulator with XRE-family HTH domain
MTQEELASSAVMTTKAVSTLERGEERKPPYPHTVRSLANALELSEHILHVPAASAISRANG